MKTQSQWGELSQARVVLSRQDSANDSAGNWTQDPVAPTLDTQLLLSWAAPCEGVWEGPAGPEKLERC